MLHGGAPGLEPHSQACSQTGWSPVFSRGTRTKTRALSRRICFSFTEAINCSCWCDLPHTPHGKCIRLLCLTKQIPESVPRGGRESPHSTGPGDCKRLQEGQEGAWPACLGVFYYTGLGENAYVVHGKPHRAFVRLMRESSGWLTVLTGDCAAVRHSVQRVRVERLHLQIPVYLHLNKATRGGRSPPRSSAPDCVAVSSADWRPIVWPACFSLVPSAPASLWRAL